MAVPIATARRHSIPIPIACGTGEGRTELAAFDAALVAAGVADRNLIALSPCYRPVARWTGSNASRTRPASGATGSTAYWPTHGRRSRTPRCGPGSAGCRTDGRGLLVEHHAPSAPALSALIEASLDGLGRNRCVTLPDRGSVIAEPAARTVRCVRWWSPFSRRSRGLRGRRRDTVPAARIAAAVVSLVDLVPYVRDTLRQLTRPHRGTWLIWSALGATGFASQLADGDLEPLDGGGADGLDDAGVHARSGSGPAGSACTTSASPRGRARNSGLGRLRPAGRGSRRSLSPPTRSGWR
jgi:arginine decarboxylase